jgi:hypothetical protein
MRLTADPGQTLLTAYEISGQVMIRYCKLPTMMRYSVDPSEERSSPTSSLSVVVMGVVAESLSVPLRLFSYFLDSKNIEKENKVFLGFRFRCKKKSDLESFKKFTF